MSTTPPRPAGAKQIRSALKIYRVLAVIAGIALFVLLLEMLMKYVFKQANVLTEYWSPIHGLIYMAYVASVANLGIKASWGMGRIVRNMLAGFVPVLPWVLERRNAVDTEALLERGHFAGGPEASRGAAPTTS